MTLNQRALRRVSAAITATVAAVSLSAPQPAEAAQTTVQTAAAVEAQAQAAYIPGLARCRAAGWAHDRNKICLFDQEFYGGNMIWFDSSWSGGTCFNLHWLGWHNRTRSYIIDGQPGTRGWTLIDWSCRRPWGGWSQAHAVRNDRMYAVGPMDISALDPR